MPDSQPLLDASDLGSAIDGALKGSRPGRVFMVWGDTGGRLRELKSGDLRDRIERLGSLFSSWRLDSGTRLLVSSRNDMHTVTLVMACLAHGLSAVIVDPDLACDEASSLIERVQPGAAILDTDVRSKWDMELVPTVLPISGEVRKGGALFRRLLGSPNPAEQSPHSYPAVVEEHEPSSIPGGLDDGMEAYVLFTSGSTGGSKAVSISRRSLFAHARTLSTHLCYSRATRLMSALPLTHTDGLIHGCLVPWLIGGICLRPIPFTVSRIGELLDAIYTHRATDFLVVPTLLALFERFGEGYDDAFQTEEFKLVVSSAAQLDEPLWRRFQDRFGIRVVNVYGLTETVVGGLFCGPDSSTFRFGTIGRPVDCEARIVAEDGTSLPTGQTGELQIRGEMLMSGYVGDPAATRRVLNDGWFATGDVAVVDDEGYFRIVGRRKNLVISGGRNVHPEEVSDVLLRFPGVAEAVAFGIDDATFGEAVAACVVLENRCHASVEDLRSWCRDNLVSYKIPRVLQRVPSLPRGPAGKIDIGLTKKLVLGAQHDGRSESTGDIHERLLAAAAETFAVPVERLGSGSSPDNTPGWDSFGHLALILALEDTFEVRLATADILEIGSLAAAETVVLNKLAEASNSG